MNICEHPCYYYGRGRHGPVCNCFGTINPYKTECERYIPAEVAEKFLKKESETSKLLSDLIDRLSIIKVEQLEIIADKELKAQLTEIVLIAKQFKPKG
jgi:hypothetical protein